MKIILLLSVIAAFTLNTTMAQTVKDNIEKLARNPKTTEHAAKADTRIQDKKVIAYPPGQSKNTSNSKATNSTTARKKKTICKPVK